MKIIVTASELMEMQKWLEFCDLRGINSWGVNEGLFSSSQEFELTKEEAIELKIIK